MSNQKKNDTLGMPHGTASARLRKIILFDLLRRHNENMCVRCQQPILLIEELSIEHIKPWEGRSAELFWDLKNIAFSHTRCNRPHEHPGNPESLREHPYHTKTKEAPEGTAWCTGHKDYLLIEAFHSNERNVNGVASYCKECRKTRLD